MLGAPCSRSEYVFFCYACCFVGGERAHIVSFVHHVATPDARAKERTYFSFPLQRGKVRIRCDCLFHRGSLLVTHCHVVMPRGFCDFASHSYPRHVASNSPHEPTHSRVQCALMAAGLRAHTTASMHTTALAMPRSSMPSASTARGSSRRDRPSLVCVARVCPRTDASVPHLSFCLSRKLRETLRFDIPSCPRLS